MPDLASLGLTEESCPQVDWDSPEGGKTPPRVFPGEYIFKFGMPEDVEEWFAVVDRALVRGGKEKKKFLEITYIPTAIAMFMQDAKGKVATEPTPIADQETGEPIVLGPQRVSTWMSVKMTINMAAELLRGMGVRIEGSWLAVSQNNPAVSVIQDTLTQLNGKAQFRAEVIWRTYFKSTETTFSSRPRGREELPWPRNAQGELELMATNPSTGEKAFAYAEISRVKMPVAEVGASA